MKKIALALMLALAVGLAGCAGDPELKATGFEIDGAQKLTVMSGSSGTTIEIADEADIAYITDNICSLAYSKGDKVNIDGWSYSLQWFDADGNAIISMALLGDGYTVIYDGYFYKGMEVDYEIDLEFLDSLFAE